MSLSHPFITGLSLAIAILIASAASRVQAAELPFPVETVKPLQLPRQQVLDGVVEAVNQSTVSAQTSGQINEIQVDVNDFVEQGMVIIRLRDAEQKAAFAQAQAALEEAQARFNEAEAEYKRVKQIFDRKLVAKSDMDAASAARSAAQARLDAAKAGLEQAQEQLDYTVIEAPYSGVVLERHVQMGETVQPGKPLMTGFSLDQLRVVVEVPQRLLESVRQNENAQVVLPDGESSVDAQKLTFFPYADPESNVFKVRVYLPDNTPGIYPGMFVKVRFNTGSTERLLIPSQALIQRSEVSAVYVVAENQVSLRQIRIGRTIDGHGIEVLAGLDAGEQIALEPLAAAAYLKQAAAEPAQ